MSASEPFVAGGKPIKGRRLGYISKNRRTFVVNFWENRKSPSGSCSSQKLYATLWKSLFSPGGRGGKRARIGTSE